MSLRRSPFMCNIRGSNHDTDQQCMDVVNTVQCWTEEHIRYAMPPLLMLPPYYAFAMHLKMTAQVHRSRTPHACSLVACAARAGSC